MTFEWNQKLTTLTTSNRTECETICALEDSDESRSIGRRFNGLYVRKSGSDLFDVVLRSNVRQVTVHNSSKICEKKIN